MTGDLDDGELARDLAVFVDNEGDAIRVSITGLGVFLRRAAQRSLGYAHAVLFGDLTVVREQREVELVLLGEVLVGFFVVERNTDDLCIELVEIRDPVAEGFRLGNSTRGFVFGIEVQHDRRALELGQGDHLPGVRLERKVRRGVAHLGDRR